MANQLQGLFGNPSGAANFEADFKRLQSGEREARIRQAMMDTSNAGGGFQASQVAKYRQQGQEALGQIGQGIATGLGSTYEDPRLTAARTRNKDRTEIMSKLDGFMDDGVISEKEMQIGFSELMSRGYKDEAKEFLAMAQSMAGVRQNEIIANAKKTKAGQSDGSLGVTRMIEDSKGNKFYARQYSVGDEAKTIYSGVGNTLEGPVEGDIEVINNNVGMTGSDIQSKQIALLEKKFDNAVEKDKKQSELKMKEEQKKADIEGVAQEKRDWVKSRDIITQNARDARDVQANLNKVIDLLKTGPNTGGIYEAKQDVLDFFGWGKDTTLSEIRYRLTDTILAKLKETGTKPTDADLKFIRTRLADISKGNPQNIAILEAVSERLNKVISRGKIALYGDFTTKTAYEQALDKAESTEEAPSKTVKWSDL